mmetsp:Transcript_7326/g.21592  ORF Transcript_7326/g.21592 Transcript_7326/m.21592 type:complete len:211 (+) Transcript_7326:2399-3031(+)
MVPTATLTALHTRLCHISLSRIGVRHIKFSSIPLSLNGGGGRAGCCVAIASGLGGGEGEEQRHPIARPCVQQLRWSLAKSLEQMAEAHGSIGAPTVVSWTARSKLPPEPPPRPLVLLGAHLVFIYAVRRSPAVGPAQKPALGGRQCAPHHRPRHHRRVRQRRRQSLGGGRPQGGEPDVQRAQHGQHQRALQGGRHSLVLQVAPHTPQSHR